MAYTLQHHIRSTPATDCTRPCPPTSGSSRTPTSTSPA
jgi:hypothetical protein